MGTTMPRAWAQPLTPPVQGQQLLFMPSASHYLHPTHCLLPRRTPAQPTSIWGLTTEKMEQWDAATGRESQTALGTSRSLASSA